MAEDNVAIEYASSVNVEQAPPEPVKFEENEKLKVNGKGVAVAQGDGVKGEIGVLLFATFGDMKVPQAKTFEWFTNQIDVRQSVMPKAPEKMDAYKNVCAADNTDIWFKVDEAAAEEFERMYGQKVRVEYLSLPTKDGKNEYVLCRRIWVIEPRNIGANLMGDETVEITPEHPKIARLKFDMAGDRVVVVPFPDFENSPMIPEIEKIANEEYQREKTVISGSRHRGSLHRLVEATGGVAFGFGGGCFFVPSEAEAEIKAFKRYLTEVARNYGITGHTTDIRVMPVVDTEEMRDDIARDVAREVSAKYNELLGTTLAYLEEKKDVIAPKDLARVERAMAERLGQAERLKIMKERYEGLLGKKIRITMAKLDLPPNVSGRTKALLGQMAKLVDE